MVSEIERKHTCTSGFRADGGWSERGPCTVMREKLAPEPSVPWGAAGGAWPGPRSGAWGAGRLGREAPRALKSRRLSRAAALSRGGPPDISHRHVWRVSPLMWSRAVKTHSVPLGTSGPQCWDLISAHVACACSSGPRSRSGAVQTVPRPCASSQGPARWQEHRL